MKTPYPGYDVLGKWDSPSYNDQTRAVLARRLHDVPARRFFSPAEWRCLEAVAARLIPQPDRSDPVPITPWIDDQLATGRGEGYRREGTPPPQDAWRAGLAGIEDEARRRYGRDFALLGPEMQDAILEAIQGGAVEAEAWTQIPARHFFSDILLKTVVGIYYAHPVAWNEIGFGGPASPRGYVRLGVDERDPWEARLSREAGEAR